MVCEGIEKHHHIKYTQKRRGFIKNLLIGLATPMFTSLSPLSVFAQPDASTPPFKMLVLGDSVVWGQGLVEEAKFYTIVKKRIEQDLLRGRTVHMLNLSHSGAAILPKAKACPSVPGEVPLGTPTIYAQVNSASSIYASSGVKPEEVNLVLLNGGINDIGFPLIVNPATKEKTLIKLSKKFCLEEMEKLLLTLHKTFPKADLLVTGYFPMISRKTDPEFVMKLIRAFFGLSKGNDLLRDAAKRQKEQLKRAGKMGDLNSMQSNWLIDRLTTLSDVWKRTSDADLEAAVNRINSRSEPLPGPRTRALFVKVNFLPEECYGASNTHLWKITGSGGGLGNFVTDDQMFSQRAETCRLVAADLNSRAKLICPIAGTGHPNVLGSQKYADAITDKLKCLLAGPC